MGRKKVFLRLSRRDRIKMGYRQREDYARQLAEIIAGYRGRNFISEIFDVLKLARHHGAPLDVPDSFLDYLPERDAFSAFEIIALLPLIRLAFFPNNTQPRLTIKALEHHLDRYRVPYVKGVAGSNDMFMARDGLLCKYFIMSNPARYLGKIFTQSDFEKHILRLDIYDQTLQNMNPIT